MGNYDRWLNSKVNAFNYNEVGRKKLGTHKNTQVKSMGVLFTFIHWQYYNVPKNKTRLQLRIP